MPKTFIHTATVALTTNTDSVMLTADQFSAIKDAVVVSIFTRFSGKSLNKTTIANTAVGNSLFLELFSDGNRRVLVPLSLVEKQSNNGFAKGFPCGFVINWGESKLISNDPSVLTTGEVVELTFEVLK